MQVGLLGPLEVAGPDGRLQIGGAKERLVLALLALRSNEVVSRDALVDALWGDAPPTTAVKTLQGYVARVRRALEGAGLADVLATRPPGYVLGVPVDSFDVARFERLASAGHAAFVAGDAARAATELEQALQLWRGDALADCRGNGWAEAEAVRLDELRLSTTEDRIDADLMLGRDSELVGELESLVAQHPLHERLWAALMLALFRSGRQADSLRAFQRARDVLVEELGLEPGAELRRLESAVLAGDPSLNAPELSSGPAKLAIPLPARVATASAAVFVGRAHEREQLNESLSSVAAGERRVLLLSGDPGIGKTSLSAEFARDAFADGAIVLYGRCDEDLGIPYQPWAEALSHLVAHAPPEMLAAHVDARGPELTRLAPDLALRTATGTDSSSDAESERYLLFGAVVDVLARLSARAPVVLVLDDLHWADRPTLQLLRHLVSADVRLRLCIIGTFRSSDVSADHPLAESLAALHREPNVERLALRGLPDEELLTFVERTAHHTAAEDRVALRDALSAETDGNPFFVGELLRHLSETGAIYEDEHGEWIAGTELRTSGLPVSIREVIGRRVARLGPSTRRALTTAAVIGRDFDADVLARVAELDEDTVIRICDHAVAAALLTEADTAGRYTFAHALIEHALYDVLSAGRRGRTHRAVAEALEELCGADPGERIGELAWHWARAAHPPDPEKAMTYAQLAGDRALAQLAPDEALRWFRDALDLLDQSVDDDPRRRAALLLGLGDAQRQTGDPAHRDTLLAAGGLADEVDAVDLLVLAALRNNRGWNSVVGGVDHERVAMLKRALARLSDSDSPDRARLMALLCAESTWAVDLDERLSMATEAVDIARRTGDKPALVYAIRLCHESITMPQTLDLRLRWNEEACKLADDLGDPTARLHANDWWWLAAIEAGDLATMRTVRVVFESESERIGQPLNRWQVAYHWALQRMIDGELDAAERYAADALTLGTGAGYSDDATRFHHFQLLTLRSMQGRGAEMIELIPQAVRVRPGNQIFRAALVFAKSFDDPERDVPRLLDAAVADDFPKFADATWLVAHVFWAEAAARTGHRPASEILYQRLLPWCDQFATTHVTVHGGVAHYLGLLARALDRRDEADAWFSRALALHESMEARFFVALTQTAWASLLVDRNTPGDCERARSLATAALPVATNAGYEYVERDARAALARLA